LRSILIGRETRLKAAPHILTLFVEKFALARYGGAGYQPAACFQQARSWLAKKSRPEGGCRLIARPTFDMQETSDLPAF
jgi:hypothetical protein